MGFSEQDDLNGAGIGMVDALPDTEFCGPRRNPSSTDAGIPTGRMAPTLTDATLMSPEASKVPSRHAS